MKNFLVPSNQVIDITAWCLDNFGPSYTLPNWWRVFKDRDNEYHNSEYFYFEFFNEEDATLFALRWK